MRETLKKLWNFIWHDDSLLSWVVNIILAFILIKFVVYPLLGLLFGTSFPIVAVVSESMEHDARFDKWWETNDPFYLNKNITKQQFAEFPMKNGFNKGDIIFLKRSNNLEVGDIAVFISHRNVPRSDPIIHRVINTWQENGVTHYTTKGDNNKGTINDCDSYGCIDETDIWQRQMLGEGYFRIPLLGWIKIVFVELIGNPYCKLTNNFFPCNG